MFQITLVILILKNVQSLNNYALTSRSFITNNYAQLHNNNGNVKNNILFAGSKGFGKSSSNNQSNNDNGIDDDDNDATGYFTPYYNKIIDNEETMSQFFTNYEEWMPLFRSLINTNDVQAPPALSFLGEAEEISTNSIDFSDLSTPWKQLDGMPKEEDELSVIAEFLDAIQQSLIDIPVNEAVEEDAADLRFIEEGRRLLVLSRFHVLQKDSTAIYDELFTTCWSEIAHYIQSEEIDAGSLILLPNTLDISDIRNFADMCIYKPLTWLGIDNDFEIESLNNAYPAIRLIHKLSDIPVVEEPSVDVESSSA